MSLIFNRKGILERNKGLTFDDVLLVPNYSEIASRAQPQINTQLTKKLKLATPIISANMDTITEKEMVVALAELGGIGILHRFMSTEEQITQIQDIKKAFADKGIKAPIAASIGVKQEGKDRSDKLASEGVDVITIDIAHGDSIMMIETLAYVKKTHPHIQTIVGNLATPEATRRLIEAGADAIKVGIGPGSMCTTRVITGHGVPQLTAIAMCCIEADQHNIPVIADGGIRTSGDIVKALAAGASSVMLGSMLSGTLESPGEVKGGKKLYRGMASKSAQVSWRGELPEGMAAEGEATMVPCKGSVVNVVNELLGGIRSGMSYVGVEKLSDIRAKAQFIEMSTAGTLESHAHGVK